MNRVVPGTRFLRTAIVLAPIVLAGCQTLNDLKDRTFGPAPTPPPRVVMKPPMEAMLREIPLQDVTVKKPEPPTPKAPMVASVMRPPPRPPVVPAKKPPPPPKEEVPTIAPGELVGSDFNSVLQVLRKPDTVQSSALSVVWTYSQMACTLQLFFYPDIQTKVFRLLKYDLKSDAGDKMADRSACLHDMMAVKSDEPAIP